MYRDPEGFDALIERVTEATVHYLDRQIAAGAEAVKLFDSWAGTLAPEPFWRYAVEPAKRITAELKRRHPGIPVIGFPRGAGAMYPGFARTAGVDAVAVDTTVPLDWARREMSPPDGGSGSDGSWSGVALQGNLDPLLMVTGGSALRDSARKIVGQMRGAPHVFNLGHGITPEADPGNVEALLRAIQG
jgi:uroporphyrinogen decarboxylase